MTKLLNPTSKLRLYHEMEHASVLKSDPEGIWGWSTPAGRVRAARRARLIIEHGGIARGSNTLEVGCGTGVFTSLVSESGAHITACELCPELIEQARRKNYPCPVTFISGDIAQLPPENNNRYDLVWGSSVLHHLELDITLPKLFSYLKPGGRLVFAEPNMLNPQIWLERHVKYFRKLSGTSPDETAFYRCSIRKLLQKHGFIDVAVQPHEFLHPMTPSSIIPLVQKLTQIAEKIPPVREIAGSLLIKAKKPR